MTAALSNVRNKIDRLIAQAVNGCVDPTAYRREMDALQKREAAAIAKIAKARELRT